MRTILLIIAFFSAGLYGAEYSTADRLFASMFYRHYQAGKCGTNALKFTRAIRSATGNASDYSIVFIRNAGISTFGMVNAELARTTRFGKPAAGEANWYHHVFVLHRSGRVYDFDYTATPRVTSVKQYLEKMFLDEPECTNRVSGEFCGGREAKLKGYAFSAVNAESLLADPQLKPDRDSTMAQVLEDWRILFR